MARMIPLNQISVAKPCHESWDAMTGDDKKRFCGGCKKNVYNLSAMTEAEAQETLKIDNPCVRFYRRVDGTVLTQDCPVGVKRVRLRMAAAVSGAAAALLSSVAGRQVLADATMGAPPPMMGGVTAPANVNPTPIMGDVALPPRPVQGEPMMGKVAAPPKTPHAKPPKHHVHKAPKTGTTKPVPAQTPPPPPPPMQQPTMGMVAWPQHSAPPTLPSPPPAKLPDKPVSD